MTVAYRASAILGSNSTLTNYVVPAVTGLQAGDVMIAVCTTNGSGWTLPNGWTNIYNDTVCRVCYRVADVTDIGATHTFVVGAGGAGGVGLHCYSGALFDAGGGNSQSTAAPSVTGVHSGLTVVRILTDIAFGSGPPTINVPPGTVQRANLASNWLGSACADSLQPASGATGTATFTSTAGSSGNDRSAATVTLYDPNPPGSGRRGYNQTIKGWRGRGVLTF